MSTSTTATPPGPVQNPQAGTPTASTVPVTYTAPTTGGPVITYAGQTSVDRVTWIANSGAFNAGGGTFIGLDGSTATSPAVYHLRIVATNTYDPSSLTELSSPITMAVDTEASKSSGDLVLDALIANGDLLNLTLGGVVTSAFTVTRVTLGEALARYNAAITALANQMAAPPASTGGGAGEGGGAP